MSTLPISKQAIVTGTQAIQGFQKDGLLVPSSVSMN